MSRPDDYIHPDLRQPMPRRLAYREVVVRHAELADLAGFRTVNDLAALEADEIAAALAHYPTAFIDALADLSTTRDTVVSLLARRTTSRTDQHAFVGYAVVAALGDYLRGILWKDVQLQQETNRRNAALERENRQQA